MKRIICILACLCLLGGCSKKTTTAEPINTTIPVEDTVPVAETPIVIPDQQAMYALSVPAITEITRSEDDTVIFSYTHQSINLSLPEQDVADRVINDFKGRIYAGKLTADSILAAAETDYKPSDSWTPYLYDLTYSPMRMDQGVLSLFGNCVTYSGASHPEKLGVSASYDLVTGDVLTLASIMTPDATVEDFCKLTIDKLNTIKNEKYIYDGFEYTVEHHFAQDESLNQNWYFSTTGLCFYFAPYEIAPYSSGIIIAEIPYNELVGLIYDGYFPAERETAAGTLQVTDLNNTDISQFTQIPELILNPDGSVVFLHTNGLLWNVKIESGVWHNNGATFTPVYTAFFAASLSPGDAVMLQTNELSDLRISYNNGIDTVITHFDQGEQTIKLIF